MGDVSHERQHDAPDRPRHGSDTVSGTAARPLFRLIALLLIVFLGITSFTALGVWQLHRRVWKLNLIEQVEQRIHAAPVAAPGPEEWASITASRDAYRRVSVRGSFLNDRETLIQAATTYGSGYWVVTPFQSDDGFTVLVNRGFVPPENRSPATRAASQITGEVRVTGLMRMTEPGGRFLRANDPAAGRWYSCDVAAIAATDGLSKVAPYFIDADNRGGPGGLPIGGLTVISFPNNHLVYALTWFSLALLLAGFAATIAREEYRAAGRRHDFESKP